MLTINIICIGKIKEVFFRDAISEYSKRLSKYCKLNIQELPDEKILEKINDTIINEIKTKECDNISMTSSNITFIIGGSLGLNENILKLANEKICFSKLTFPHQLIRIFLLEQLFRSFKISNGETYHR